MDKKASSWMNSGAPPPEAAAACFSSAFITARAPSGTGGAPTPSQVVVAALLLPQDSGCLAVPPPSIEVTDQLNASAPLVRAIFCRSSVQISIRLDISIVAAAGGELEQPNRAGSWGEECEEPRDLPREVPAQTGHLGRVCEGGCHQPGLPMRPRPYLASLKWCNSSCLPPCTS
jgi:hypothetical protein